MELRRIEWNYVDLEAFSRCSMLCSSLEACGCDGVLRSPERAGEVHVVGLGARRGAAHGEDEERRAGPSILPDRPGDACAGEGQREDQRSPRDEQRWSRRERTDVKRYGIYIVCIYILYYIILYYIILYYIILYYIILYYIILYYTILHYVILYVCIDGHKGEQT